MNDENCKYITTSYKIDSHNSPPWIKTWSWKFPPGWHDPDYFHREIENRNLLEIEIHWLIPCLLASWIYLATYNHNDIPAWITTFHKIHRIDQLISDHILQTKHHRRTGNFLQGGGGGAVTHLPKKISQVAQIITKESKTNQGHIATT